MRKQMMNKSIFCISAALVFIVTLSTGSLWAAVPNAPSGLAVTPLSATQIRLDWTDNSTDETSFFIERKIGPDGTYSSIGTVSANVTTYTNSSLTQETTYYYRVRAYNAGYNSVD